MGKKGESKSSIFDCLPKASSPATLQSPPPSPRSPYRGFVGVHHPALAVLTEVCRVGSYRLFHRRLEERVGVGSCDEREEPSSPKVSCTGKVNNKNKIKPQATRPESSPKPAVLKGKKQGLQPDTSRRSPPDADKGPSLVHMKRFPSSCSELKDFDWRAHDVSGMPDYSSYDDKNGDKEEVFIVVEVDEDIPTEPKKQVNLWKRRSMAHPGPLQLEKLSPC
ncbi:hypothetical protein OIU85_019011 [Salix viminalis]|uniref:Uncharacterized protein n=1 Tax=Salix viminalis TaxID=40686 RepID=A0A9Q0UVM1_SALVM|nr:hypothetical protein OIU85_019011 [Salix viminalis]